MRAVLAQSGCHRRTPAQRSVQVNAEAAIRASVAGTSRFPESAFDVVAVLTPPMSVDLLDDLEHDLDADDWAAWERLYESLGCGTPTITAGHHQLRERRDR